MGAKPPRVAIRGRRTGGPPADRGDRCLRVTGARGGRLRCPNPGLGASGAGRGRYATMPTMVLEVALIDITPGQEEDVRRGIRAGQVDPCHYAGPQSVRMTRGIESPSRFVLLVEWDSVEAHEDNFRATDRVRPMAGSDRALLRPPALGWSTSTTSTTDHRRRPPLGCPPALRTTDGVRIVAVHDAGPDRARHRRRPRLHRLLAPPVDPAGGADLRRARRRDQLRLPWPRPVRRPQHRRRPRGARSRRRRRLGPRARLRQHRHRRLLDGGVHRGPPRRPDRGLARGRRGQRAQPLVLPGYRADAPGALGDRAPAGPAGLPGRPAYPHLVGRLAHRAGSAGRARGPDLTGTAAGRARRRRPYFPVEHAERLYARPTNPSGSGWSPASGMPRTRPPRSCCTGSPTGWSRLSTPDRPDPLRTVQPGCRDVRRAPGRRSRQLTVHAPSGFGQVRPHRYAVRRGELPFELLHPGVAPPSGASRASSDDRRGGAGLEVRVGDVLDRSGAAGRDHRDVHRLGTPVG